MNDETRAPRVLVVDDEAGIRGLLSKVCQRLGYHCDSAADGAEALEKLRALPFDVMLLDLMMPRVNGFEVIEALPSVPACPAVVVLTAAGEKQSASLRESPFVHTVLQKPFDVARLAQVLVSLTTGHDHQAKAG